MICKKIQQQQQQQQQQKQEDFPILSATYI